MHPQISTLVSTMDTLSQKSADFIRFTVYNVHILCWVCQNIKHPLKYWDCIEVRRLCNILLMPTSQLNSIPAAAVGFLPDADFSRSVACRTIFLTLNNVVKSPSGRLTIAAGRMFGRRSILSGNDQIFGRCPAGVPATIVRSPGSDRRESCRSPLDDNESGNHRPFTFW